MTLLSTRDWFGLNDVKSSNETPPDERLHARVIFAILFFAH